MTKKNRKQNVALSIIIIISGAFLLVACASATSTNGIPAAAFITPTPFSSSPRIAGSSELPPEKQAVLNHEATAQADGAKRAPTKDTDSNRVATRAALTRPTPEATYTIATGIAYFLPPRDTLPKSFAMSNMWQNKIKDQWILLYAGSLVSQTTPNPGKLEQGILYIFTILSEDIAGRHPKIENYLTPAIVGSIKITKVEGLNFTLLAEDGTIFTFDLSSHKFLK